MLWIVQLFSPGGLQGFAPALLLHIVSTQHASARLRLGQKPSFEMASKISLAEKKFWETTELLEKLDPESTLALAQCHKKIPLIPQGQLIWNQVIRRASCHFTDETFDWPNVNLVRCLVAILKLMKNPCKDLLEREVPFKRAQQIFAHDLHKSPR